MRHYLPKFTTHLEGAANAFVSQNEVPLFTEHENSGGNHIKLKVGQGVRFELQKTN